ncbi:hypothetical protein GOC14_07035 [Sinorhizobium meliloti]|nr:hypothetical protein [Sinorhizobium meliloti]
MNDKTLEAGLAEVVGEDMSSIAKKFAPISQSGRPLPSATTPVRPRQAVASGPVEHLHLAIRSVDEVYHDLIRLADSLVGPGSAADIDRSERPAAPIFKAVHDASADLEHLVQAMRGEIARIRAGI